MWSTFGGGSSLPKDASHGLPPVTTGTSLPAYSVTRETDPDRGVLLLQNITAMRAYKGTSSEELRVQDYQQDRKSACTSGRMSFGAPAMQTPSIFGKPSASQQTTAFSSAFGSGITGAFGTTINQPAMSPFGVFGQRQPNVATSAFGQPKPATGFGSTFRQPTGSISDPGKLECMEELLMRSLLGEELVNTEFHLFSARSTRLGRVLKPRVLCANNVLLTRGSKYFLDLLSSDINPSDPSLIDLKCDDDIPSSAEIDDYGYESDSDLDDCDDDPVPAVDADTSTDHSATLSTFLCKVGAETPPGDDNALPNGGSEPVISKTLVTDLEQPRRDDSVTENKDGATSTVSSESVGDKRLGDQTATRLWSLRSRHILVKDTAFQTWHTLLKYLYTGKFSFRPLDSATSGKHTRSSTSSLDSPRCSAKSMYRLASKVGLDHLRDQALANIRSNLTENNILTELSCNLVSKYPQLLEMELDVLYFHIASPPVVAGFTALTQRIANKELPHGADILLGIYARQLKERRPFLRQSGAPTLKPSFSGSPTPIALAAGANQAVESRHETGASNAEKRGARPGHSHSEDGEFPPSVLPETSATIAALTATSTKEQGVGRKEKEPRERK